MEANLVVPLCKEYERLREQANACFGNMASVRNRGYGKNLAEVVILGDELVGLKVVWDQ